MDFQFLSKLTRRGFMRVVAMAPVPLLLPRTAKSTEAQGTISYVRAPSTSDNDPHAAFGWELLDAVLERTRATHGDYRLTISQEAAQSVRFRHGVHGSDSQVNVAILTASPEWNDLLLPVRIPLLRGLLGYRLLLMHRQDLGRFRDINRLADLRQVTFGSVHYWADTAILEKAGVPVVIGRSYEGLFKMLLARRFDVLSVGVHEVDAEIAAIVNDPANDLVVEPHLLLHYYLPVYFWFSKDEEGHRRAERVEAGLRSMVADGTLQRMFDARFGPVIEKYGLTHRTLIEIPNPMLVPEDSEGDTRLWYRP